MATYGNETKWSTCCLETVAWRLLLGDCCLETNRCHTVAPRVSSQAVHASVCPLYAGVSSVPHRWCARCPM